jgi:hypothetical protein
LKGYLYRLAAISAKVVARQCIFPIPPRTPIGRSAPSPVGVFVLFNFNWRSRESGLRWQIVHGIRPFRPPILG